MARPRKAVSPKTGVPKAEPETADRGDSKTVTDYAYRRLRADILAGNLQPGAKLRVEQLRHQYGVGINSLREALVRLAADGFALAEGQKGFSVLPVSIADLQDITSMREQLECLALRRAIDYGDIEWEAGIVAAYHKLSRAEQLLEQDQARYAQDWEDRNREFHRALIAACNSRWLLHFQTVLYDQSQRYRMLSLTDKAIPRDEQHQEHKRIMEATLARDADRAAELLRQHISKAAAGLRVEAQVDTPARRPLEPAKTA